MVSFPKKTAELLQSRLPKIYGTLKAFLVTKRERYRKVVNAYNFYKTASDRQIFYNGEREAVASRQPVLSTNQARFDRGGYGHWVTKFAYKLAVHFVHKANEIPAVFALDDAGGINQRVFKCFGLVEIDI